MAEPMNPAAPYKNPEILAREKAIKTRLSALNNKNITAAKTLAAKKLKPYEGKKKAHTSTAFYDTQLVRGAKEGFAESDYGAEKGAAIPYQIGTYKNTVRKTYTPPTSKPTTKTKEVAISDRLKNLDASKVKGG